MQHDESNSSRVIDQMLARAIKLLCADFEQPAHRNVEFVAKRLLELVTGGHRLADIETALRAGDAPIFLVGLPWSAEKQIGRRLYHPDSSLDGAALRYSLWIGINGQHEVDRVLAEASLSPTMNLINLNATGFMKVDDKGTELPSDPTVGELIGWLLLDAKTWTARRDAILRHQQLLSTDEAVSTLGRLAEHQDLDPSSRAAIGALGELLVRLSQEGPRLAFQNCQFLVLEGLLAFVGAPSWRDTARVYAAYEDELSGDLAAEILTEMKGDLKYTAAQRATIENHLKVLELAWEHGIETAIADAELRLGAKSGTPAAQDYLQVYLGLPDLDAACEALRTAPAELLQLDHDALVAGMRRANTEEIWRVGLLEDVRDRGVDDSFRDWAELRSIATLVDNEEAVRRLGPFLERNKGGLRDQALELLLEIHIRVGNEEAQQAIAQELVDHRSDASPPGRRPLDLVALGVISSLRGDLTTARAAFREAQTVFHQLTRRPARAQFWLKVGFFYLDYDRDVAMALHSFRVAAEECAAANDLVSKAYAFEQLSSVYRSLARVDLAAVYAALAERSIVDLDSHEHGVAGSYDDVRHDVQKGIAVTEFLLGDYGSAAERVQWLLNESPVQLSDEGRVELERVALACAIENGDWSSARGIVTSWSGCGRSDWALIGRAAITVAESAQVDPDGPIDPAQSADFVGSAEALRSIGGNVSDVERLLQPSTHRALSRALVDTLAGIQRPDLRKAARLFGDHEAEVWVSRSERYVAAAARTTTPEQDRPAPLPWAAPWSQIIARYDHLGAWEIPDLTVIGPILDRWSLLSRFEGAVRINPVPPCDGCLNVYFYRSDPEGHLSNSVSSCAYFAEGDLIICSLPYIDNLFRVCRVSWSAEVERIKQGLIGSGWQDVDNLAVRLANQVRARERVLLEWLIAHEIGHAHFSHSDASTGETGLALEDQADSFFIDGVVEDGSVGEILQSIYGQLNLLYQYDCEKQFNRALTPEESRDRSLRLDPAPDASGHRPLVFRAVSLVRSIQRMQPDLQYDSYIDEFAASLEGGSDEGMKS